MMAGTFLLLGRAGCELHYMTLANGSCGTNVHDAETIIRIRREEARAAAQTVGAIYHEALVNDLEIFYERATLRQLAAVVREVAPEIVLTHALQEYMEDHTNTTRLALTAVFARGMTNFPVEPPQPITAQPATIYHALPYGLRDPLRRRVRPELFVNISDVLPVKAAMLTLHRSQREWLDASQGIGSYLRAMEEMAEEVGRQSATFTHAEGWTRHLHLGYCAEDADPLVEVLGDAVIQRGSDSLGLPTSSSPR